MSTTDQQAIADTCQDCGRQIEREDTPLPGASWAPVPVVAPHERGAGAGMPRQGASTAC